MKNSYLFIAVFVILASISIALAQTPEKIYAKNKILKDNEYYLQQIDLWKQELSKNQKNADAWLNFYRASRNAYIKGEEDNSQKSKGENRFRRLTMIVDEMEKQVPETFEFNFAKWLNGNNDLKLLPFLQKAQQISPNNPEVLMHLIFYYEIQGDYKKRDKYIEAYYKLGDYSPGLLNYSYNLLIGLEKNAIIITEGDKDTEAILLLTKGRKFQQDIKMLNVNLLLQRDYRERVFAELGVDNFDFEPMKDEQSYQKYQKILIQHIAKNKLQRPVYVSITVSNSYTEGISDELFLIGLSYQYSKSKLDNLSILKRNVEELYLLDYLKEYFPIDISLGNVNSMNGNYLYAFAALSKYYLTLGDKSKAEYYKEQAYKVAEAANGLDEYKNYFKE